MSDLAVVGVGIGLRRNSDYVSGGSPVELHFEVIHLGRRSRGSGIVATIRKAIGLNSNVGYA